MVSIMGTLLGAADRPPMHPDKISDGKVWMRKFFIEPKIRDATETDIPKLLAMAECFITLAWSRIGVSFDETSCRTLLQNLIAEENGILLIDDDCTAMIGAIVHPWHFNQNIMTATELFWWAGHGSRAAMALWEIAELRALERGAETFNMACQHHMRGEALGKLYNRKGYVPSEHIFIREIG